MRESLEVTPEGRGRFGRSATRRILAVVVVLCFFASAWAGVAWPLRVSGNGRYVEDQNGVPFFLIGDSGWLIIDQLTPTQMDTYINDRASRGFTAIMVMGIFHGYHDSLDYAGNHPFTNGDNDWSVRNESYWQTVDLLLNKAKAKNMVVLLAHSYLGYGCSATQGWCPSMVAQTDAAMTEYGTWLGTRYAAQGNIIWVDGGDADCTQTANACSRVQAVKNGIDSRSSYLHTGHGGRNNTAATIYPWIGLYSSYSEATHAQYRDKVEYDRTPTKPYLYIEGTYEGEGAMPVNIASEAFWAYFGGAFLWNFGNHPVWEFTSGWDGAAGIASPGSIEASSIGALLRSRAWWRLSPDFGTRTIVGGGGGDPTSGNTSYVPAARTSDGETVMAYIPGYGPITVDMTKVSGSSAKAWWYNPETGGSTLAGTYATTGTRSFTPPSSNYVLVLDDAAKGLATPGTTVYPYSGGGSTNPPPAPTKLRVN